MFQKAVKTSAKLRLAIAGPSGSGKTYSSLAIAQHLGGRVALVDTEHGSASKYADKFDFDVLELRPPFHPDRFCKAIQEAEQAGYSVLILDSLTHAWSGTGGLLEVVDQIAARMKTTNTFAAWKDATPIQNRLVEAIIGANMHIIATIRSKQEYIQDTDADGRKRIRKVGMAPQQREGFEYEFDVFTEMDIENNLLVSKTRCPDLTNKVFPKPGKDIADILVHWLQGAPAAPRRDPEPVSPAVTVTAADADFDAIPSAQEERAQTPTAQIIARLTAAGSRGSAEPLDEPTSRKLYANLKNLTHGDNGQAKHLLKLIYGVESSKDLTIGQALAVIQWINSKPDETGEWVPNGPALSEYAVLLPPEPLLA